MKVLQFVPSLNRWDGGTTTYMEQLTPVMGSLCELHVCALGNVQDFVPLKGCQVHGITMSVMKACCMRREWMALLDEIRPDVVHVNCCWMPQCACVIKWTNEWRQSPITNHQSSITNHQSSIKILLTPHGMLEPWIISRNYWTRKLPAIWLYQRAAVKKADMLVATAESEKEHLMALGWNRNIALVQNGIDVRAIEVKDSWKEPRELLFMSRIHPKKGLEMLFEAMKECGNTFACHLSVAGEGDKEYVDSLKKMANEMGLGEKVSFLGAVYGNDKWRLIRAADVVLLPSYSENYGLIVSEALASGTPVMTTTGTPWHSIKVRQCGWWIEPTVGDIRSALVQMSEMTAEQMKLLGRNARLLAEEECDIEEKITSLYNLYVAKMS